MDLYHLLASCWQIGLRVRGTEIRQKVWFSFMWNKKWIDIYMRSNVGSPCNGVREHLCSFSIWKGRCSWVSWNWRRYAPLLDKAQPCSQCHTCLQEVCFRDFVPMFPSHLFQVQQYSQFQARNSTNHLTYPFRCLTYYCTNLEFPISFSHDMLNHMNDTYIVFVVAFLLFSA